MLNNWLLTINRWNYLQHKGNQALVSPADTNRAKAISLYIFNCPFNDVAQETVGPFIEKVERKLPPSLLEHHWQQVGLKEYLDWYYETIGHGSRHKSGILVFNPEKYNRQNLPLMDFPFYMEVKKRPFIMTFPWE